MILIISANWMTALYPCRSRTLLTNNIFIRHLFGFFTMIFFVVLSNSKTSNLYSTFIYGIALYAFFIMMLRTPLMIFLSIMCLLLICYVLNVKKNEINEDVFIDANTREKYLHNINHINNTTSIVTCVILLFGFIVYLGQKKIEYKTKFKYVTFLFGKSECLDNSPKTTYISGILHSLD